MRAKQPGRTFFFILLTVSAVLLALVIRPLATALFLATVMAVVLWPLYRKLSARLGQRPVVASGVVVIAMVILLIAPLAGFSAFIVNEGSQGLQVLSSFVRSDGVTKLLHKLPAPMEKWAAEMLAQIPKERGSGDVSDPGEALKEGPKDEHANAQTDEKAQEKSDEQADKPTDEKPQEHPDTPTDEKQGGSSSGKLDPRVVEQVTSGGAKAVAAVGAAASATGSLLFQAAMMLIALFFLLVHGDELVAWLDGVLPLPHGQTRELLTEFKNVSYAVVISTVVTAAVQAAAALVGYLIASVPHPLFFASVTFFVAFIPAIGAASVCLVAALILFSSGHPYMALFLVIWGLTVVGLVDNLVKPLLIRSGMKMSGAIVFFALIGGLGAFGTPGLLIGPLVVAFFLALLRIYERDFKKPTPT